MKNPAIIIIMTNIIVDLTIYYIWCTQRGQRAARGSRFNEYPAHTFILYCNELTTIQRAQKSVVAIHAAETVGEQGASTRRGDESERAAIESNRQRRG